MKLKKALLVCLIPAFVISGCGKPTKDETGNITKQETTAEESAQDDGGGGLRGRRGDEGDAAADAGKQGRRCFCGAERRELLLYAREDLRNAGGGDGNSEELRGDVIS